MPNNASNGEVVAVVVLTTVFVSLAFIGMIHVLAWIFN